MTYYDNQANVIDYFNAKPQPQPKREKVELEEISDNEIAELLETMLLKRQGLQEMYQGTQSEFTLKAISKLTSFISAIRMQMRKRKIVPYEELERQILSLQIQLKDAPSAIDADTSKKIKHLELVNENLKNEVKALKGKGSEALISSREKTLRHQIEDLKLIISQNREAEKTKRHEMNIQNDKYKFEYCKRYLKEMLSDEEYQGILEDLKEMSNV